MAVCKEGTSRRVDQGAKPLEMAGRKEGRSKGVAVLGFNNTNRVSDVTCEMVWHTYGTYTNTHICFQSTCPYTL
eukprot:scaffold118608_cov15-Tisochrysis_lutea.AAC.1